MYILEALSMLVNIRDPMSNRLNMLSSCKTSITLLTISVDHKAISRISVTACMAEVIFDEPPQVIQVVTTSETEGASVWDIMNVMTTKYSTDLELHLYYQKLTIPQC